MDMTHVSELSDGIVLTIYDLFPLGVGAGAVDPELIEPLEPEPEIEELIAFRCSVL
jgi:hypothetical protein